MSLPAQIPQPQSRDTSVNHPQQGHSPGSCSGSARAPQHRRRQPQQGKRHGGRQKHPGRPGRSHQPAHQRARWRPPRASRRTQGAQRHFRRPGGRPPPNRRARSHRAAAGAPMCQHTGEAKGTRHRCHRRQALTDSFEVSRAHRPNRPWGRCQPRRHRSRRPPSRSCWKREAGASRRRRGQAAQPRLRA